MQDLIIPAWIQKNDTLYHELRRRTFHSQADLDQYIRRVAKTRVMNKRRNGRVAKFERMQMA